MSDDPAELDTTETEFDQMWAEASLRNIQVVNYYDGALEFTAVVDVIETFDNKVHTIPRMVYGTIAPDSPWGPQDVWRIYDCWILPPKPNQADPRWDSERIAPDFHVREDALNDVIRRERDVGQPRGQGTAEQARRQVAATEQATGRPTPGRPTVVVVNGDDELPDTPSDRIRE